LLLDTELFSIRLDIVKATNMNIECIILITDSLDSAKKVVDLFVYSRQAYFLAAYSVLRLFFSCGLNYKIEY